MYPRNFEYFRVETLEQLWRSMETLQEWKIIAGGQSLVPSMKLRVLSPSCLIDIGSVTQLKHMGLDKDGSLRIGAMVTHNEIEESNLVQSKFHLLSSTASAIGDLQIRSKGTIGGSICHADPSSDYLPTLFALDAKVSLRSKDASKVVPVRDFIVDTFTTRLESMEILESVIIHPYSGKALMEKFSRRKADFAIANVAAILDTDSDKVKDVKVAVGSQQQGAKRLVELEQTLKGRAFKRDTLVQAVEKAAEALDPIDDFQASAKFRKAVTKTMLVRVLTKLAQVNDK